MLSEREEGARNEKAWKESVNKLKEEIETMNKRVAQFKSQELLKVDHLEAKDEVLEVELKIAKNELAQAKKDVARLVGQNAEFEQEKEMLEQRVGLL